MGRHTTPRAVAGGTVAQRPAERTRFRTLPLLPPIDIPASPSTSEPADGAVLTAFQTDASRSTGHSLPAGCAPPRRRVCCKVVLRDPLHSARAAESRTSAQMDRRAAHFVVLVGSRKVGGGQHDARESRGRRPRIGARNRRGDHAILSARDDENRRGGSQQQQQQRTLLRLSEWRKARRCAPPRPPSWLAAAVSA